MADMARAAVMAGFTHYGFSPHSPIPIPSPCNMSADDVPAYIAEADRLKQLYADSGCRFYTGMEIDYLGHGWGPHSEYFHTLPLDYTIGSVHFIPSPAGEMVDIDGRFENFRRKMTEHFNEDIRYVVETFFAQSMEMLRLGGFDILGHMDKVAANASAWQADIESQPYYIDLVHTLIDEVAAHDILVEINTKAQPTQGRIFPDRRWIEIMRRRGIRFIVNSDAHDPALINAGRDVAYTI